MVMEIILGSSNFNPSSLISSQVHFGLISREFSSFALSHYRALVLSSLISSFCLVLISFDLHFFLLITIRPLSSLRGAISQTSSILLVLSDSSLHSRVPLLTNI
jgi:hypothetical protein